VSESNADREKRLVALSSVLAAVVLTGMKLVVGIKTGSLGILSEAAHSGLDLVAAGVTLLAVRMSGRPADEDHPYGHGKVENLSALFETVLLLVTCVWIIHEAVVRLFYRDIPVAATTWAFLTVGLSILVDFSRSRALMRVARKYDSQALEADALHFSTDIWSSTVVLLGLILVRLASLTGIGWLAHADAVAALGVAAIVVLVSLRLGRRTVNDLLDTVPPSLRRNIARVARVPGVTEVRRARLRKVGPEVFADLTLAVDRRTPLERTHQIQEQAAHAVRALVPGADVIVQIDPVWCSDERILAGVELMALRCRLRPRSMQLLEEQGRPLLEVEVESIEDRDEGELVRETEEFETSLRQALPWLGRIVTRLRVRRALSI
jgi:cation diffusion facilitator family transporter